MIPVRINPHFQLEEIELYNGKKAIVIDQVLENPDDFVQYAMEHLPQLQNNARYHFPGPELNLPGEHVGGFYRLYRRHVAHRIGTSRAVTASMTRLSLTTSRPEQLSWTQRMCHTDDSDNEPGRATVASVLYLFRDADMGGTAIYRDKALDTYRALVRQLKKGEVTAKELADEYPFFARKPQYVTSSSEFAELQHVIPARWNRIVFYLGEIPHSGHITRPDKLSILPSKGRLTINCFYYAWRL